MEGLTGDETRARKRGLASRKRRDQVAREATRLGDAPCQRLSFEQEKWKIHLEEEFQMDIDAALAEAASRYL